MHSILFLILILIFSSVYDVTRRQSFTSVEHWLNEVENYSTNPDVIKLLVGNKVDKVITHSPSNVMNNTTMPQSTQGFFYPNKPLSDWL